MERLPLNRPSDPTPAASPALSRRALRLDRAGIGALLLIPPLSACGSQEPPLTPPPPTAPSAISAAPIESAAPALVTPQVAYADPGTGCAPGSTCLRVNEKGAKDPAGTYTAQCTGRFPDFIESRMPAGYKGPFFTLSQAFPKERPKPRALPWKGLKFRTAAGADAYMFAVRKYIYDDLQPVDFVAEKSKGAPWYHVPWMTHKTHARELVHGMTPERNLRTEEYPIKRRVAAVAVGYYNDVGAYSFGKVWVDNKVPDVKAAQFAEGSVVFKLLYTSLSKDDLNPGEDDFLEGAPEWQANVGEGDQRKLVPVRLIRIDVAVRDHDSRPTGWVFGTFAYNKAAPGKDGWERMAPVGVMWGNDPKLTQAAYDKGERPKESMISALSATYARGHLGLLGRLNGPVDNPMSACMSCHGVAQAPEFSSMLAPPLCKGATPPASCCKTEADQLLWFRNLRGDEAFGDEVGDTCSVKTKPGDVVALDYSLQQAIAVEFASQFTNPCEPDGTTHKQAPAPPPPSELRLIER